MYEILYQDIEEKKEYEAIIKKVISHCFKEEGLEETKLWVTITLTTPENIRKINQEYRNIDKTTDVLSFPMFEKDELMAKIQENTLVQEDILGDIVICVSKVEEQAKEYGHSFERELSYMVVHGFYHLMGYDHIQQEDKKLMRPKEEKILTDLKMERTKKGDLRMKKQKKNNGAKWLIAILVIFIIGAGAFLGYRIIKDRENQETAASQGESTGLFGKQEKSVQIFQGNDRPIAIMIDNHSDAWPQAGLQKAYMIYEIIVEGGETRLMALFKGADAEKIGPVRSARHYFIDYAMENDAIYAHFGESPQADKDIAKYSINEIDGIAEDGTTFWRVKDKAAPHNAVTNIAKLKQSAQNKKYKMTSNKESVLNYVTEEVNLEDGQGAVSVTIPHSQLQTVKYEYDEENKVYERYARGKEQADWDSGEVITTKNIIITFCDNYTLNDKENKGRQGLKNIGTFDGYYITNGKAIKIKCIKEARDEQTKYQDLAGNEIKVNDGNTFVNICPVAAKVIIEEPTAVETPKEE